MLTACITDSVVTGTVQAHYLGITGTGEVMVDGKAPTVCGLSLDPGPNSDFEISTQTQQISIGTNRYEEHALPAIFSVYIDNQFVGSIMQIDNSQTTYTSAELRFEPANMRMGLHKIVVIAQDSLANTNESGPFVKYFRTPAGNPPSSAIDWLLVYQNLAEGAEQGTWIKDGHDYSYHIAGNLDQPVDTLGATAQEVAEALLTLKDYDPEYVASQKNVSINQGISVKRSIEAGLAYLAGKMLDKTVQDPTTRMYAAETILELRDRGGDVVLPDIVTGQDITVAWSDIVVSATAVARENLTRLADGGIGAAGLQGSSHLATMRAMRLALSTTGTLTTVQINSQIDDWKKYLKHNFEVVQSGATTDSGETGGWALNQWDWWNKSRICYTTAEILRTIDMIEKHYGHDADSDRLMNKAKAFLESQEITLGSGCLGFGDPSSQDSDKVTTASVISTASSLWALKQAGLIEPQTLLDGVAFLDGSIHGDHSWNERAMDTALALRLMKPDLTITAIGSPALNRDTGYVEYPVCIRNIGVRPAYSFDVTAHSADPIGLATALRADSEIGHSTKAIGMLDTDQSTTVTVSMKDTAELIYFMADSGDQVQELDEDNNTKSFKPDPRPDLVVVTSSIKFGKLSGEIFTEDSSLFVAKPWAVQVTVKNIGLGTVHASDSAYAAIYFGNYWDSTAKLVTMGPVKELAASSTATFNIPMSDMLGMTLEDGYYPVSVLINPGSAREVSSANNSAVGVVYLYPTGPNKVPDLQVSPLRLSVDKVESGVPFKVLGSVTNLGEGIAQNPGLEMTIDGLAPRNPEKPLGNMNPGDVAEFEFWATLSAPGGILNVKADPDNRIKEVREDNNATSASVVISHGVDLAVAPRDTDVEIKKNGDLWELTVIVRNLGDEQFNPGPNPPMIAVSKWQDGIWATMSKVRPASVNKVMGADDHQTFTWPDCPFVTGENRIHIELVKGIDNFPSNDSRDVNFKIEAVNYAVGGFWAEPACQTLDPGKATAPFRFHYEVRNKSDIPQSNVLVEIRNGDKVLWGRNISHMNANSTTSGLTREIGMYPPHAMLTLKIDPYNELIETEETDNTTNTTIALISTGAEPDLAFANQTINVTTGAESGQARYTVLLNVANLPGRDNVTPDPSGRFKVAIYRTDTNTTVAETEADSIPGRTQTVVPVVIKDSDVSGNVLLVKLDALNEVAESNEDNNTTTLLLSRVPVPINLTARSILRDGRLTWSDSPDLGQPGFISATELCGYRISRYPEWSGGANTFVSKTAAKNGNFTFNDLGLDAATSYTYRVATVAASGMESLPVVKSLKTSCAPTIEGYHVGQLIANGGVIQAQLSKDRKLYLKITAPQADKVVLYHDDALTGTVLADSDHDGVVYTTETLHIGGQTFMARPMVEYNDGNGTTIALGAVSPRYAVTYQTGIDLVVSPYELQIQNWDGASWKNVTPKEMNDLKGEQKFRVKAIVHNTESLDAREFKLKFTWTTNLRALSEATKTARTVVVQLSGLPAGEYQEVYSCNLPTESSVFVKPADRMVQTVSVLADSDYEIVETFEYNNYAQVLGSEYLCDTDYDFVFLLDTSAGNNFNSFERSRAELDRWIRDLNDDKHRVSVITFDASGATNYLGGWLHPFEVSTSTTLGIAQSKTSGRNLAAALQKASDSFADPAARKNTATPVIVLIDGGNGSNYDRTNTRGDVVNTSIGLGTETSELLAAIRRSNQLKRDIGYTKRLQIYQLHFTHETNDQWLYQEEAMFMRHLNSELDVELRDLQNPVDSPYAHITQNTACDDAPITFDTEIDKMHSSSSILDCWGLPATQYDRYWLEGFTQVQLYSETRNTSCNIPIAELKGDRICRGILLWPKNTPIPDTIASQSCSLWPSEGRYGYRRWMLNYGLQVGGTWQDYDQYIMEFYGWKTIKLFGGYINDQKLGVHHVQYAFFAHGDEQIETMYQIPQEEYVFGRNLRGEKLIDKYLKLAGPGFNHDLNGFNFYYPGLCPDPEKTDLSVAFYDPAKEPASIATGDKGFPGGTPWPQQSGELLAYVKNTGNVLVENKTIRILENDHVVTWTTVTLGPGMTTAFKYHWVNSGADSIILKVETYNFNDSNLDNNNESITIHNEVKKPNFKWNDLWVNGNRVNVGSTYTLPVRWQTDQNAIISAEYECERHFVPQVNILNGAVMTTETVNVGPTKLEYKQLIPTDKPSQPASRTLILDPYDKVLESNEADNDLPVRLKFQYLYQDAEIANIQCVDRDSSGTIHLRATVKRNCPVGQSYPFETVGVYLFHGVWIQNSDTNAKMADQTVYFDGQASDAIRMIDFWIHSDPMTTTTLSVVADPFMSELHENPSGGRLNNSKILVIPPYFVNLYPKSFVMKVNEATTDTVRQGINGILELVSHYGYGDDIPTSVTYKVRFWKGYPDRIHGEPIEDQIIANHLRVIPDRLIDQVLNTLYLDGQTAIYAEIDPRDHLAAVAAGDCPSTVSLTQSRPWSVYPIAPVMQSNSAPGIWYIDLALANGIDSTSYSTIAQWRSDRPDQTVVSPIASSGQVLLRLRSDHGLPSFSKGDHVRLNFGELNTSSLFQADDQTSAMATENGWCWKGSAATHRMDYLTTDPTHEKVLFLSTNTTGTIVGCYMLGDDDENSNPHDAPFNKALPCVSMWYNNLHTSETLTIEFLADTTSGPLTMNFVTEDSAVTTSTTRLNYALGSGYRASGWKNLFLDLNSYLQAHHPGASILSVNGICVKSNCVMIDKILLGGNMIDFYNASTTAKYVDVALPVSNGNCNSMALWVATDGSTYYANSMHILTDPNAAASVPADVNLNAEKAMNDGQGLVCEIDETDNIAQLVLNVIPTDGIDMAVERISAPKSEFVPGERVPLTVTLHNILAAHNHRGTLRIYANNDILTTESINTNGMWSRNDSRCEYTTVSTKLMTGPVVVLRAVLDVDDDSNPDNNSAETSITLTNVVSLGITNPTPSEVAPGEEIRFNVEPRSNPPMSGDVLLWVVASNGQGEASAVDSIDSMAGCSMTGSSSYACKWPGNLAVARGSYRIYGQLKINGNIAHEEVSAPFTIASNPVLSVSIGTDRLEYAENAPVQVHYSITNRSPYAAIDRPTSVTVNVRSRDYCTSFTTGIDRLEANQTLNFVETVNDLPSAEYDAIAEAECIPYNLNASAGTSFNVGKVGEPPHERLVITNSEFNDPLYVNSLETTLSLQSVGAHKMDSGDFMWIHDDQPLAIANFIENGDMSVPSGSGAMAWSGGTRISAGAGKWSLRIDQDTSATTSQSINGVLPGQNYCLSFAADQLTSDVSVTIGQFSYGGVKANEPVVFSSAGTGAWDGAQYHYEISFRTSGGTHALNLQLNWAGEGNLEISNIQLTPGTVGVPYRNRVVGSRANLLENQALAIDSGVAFERIQPALYELLDAHAGNGVPDGWRLDGDGTVTLLTDPTIPNMFKELGAQSRATITANGTNTATLSQRMVPVRPADILMISAEVKGTGEVSIFGYGADGSMQARLRTVALNSTDWTSATQSIQIPAETYNLGIEVTTSNTLSLATVSMVDSGRSKDWSGWIPYVSEMHKTLSDGADGVRSLFTRYLSDKGNISFHGMVALSRDSDSNGYLDVIPGLRMSAVIQCEGTTPTALSIAAANDGNINTSVPIDSATSISMTLSMPNVHYMECLRIAAGFQTTATLVVEGSLDGHIWLPIDENTRIRAGNRDVLIPIRRALSHWRMRIFPIEEGALNGTISEIELRGLASDEADTVIVDRASPVTHLQLVSPARTNSTTADFAGDAEDIMSGVGRIEYRMVSPNAVTTGTIAAPGIPSRRVDYTLNRPVAAEGLHQLFVRSYDQAGNVSEYTSTSLIVDRTGPVIWMDQPTSGTWFNRPVTVAWASSETLAASHGIDALRIFNSNTVTTSALSNNQQVTLQGRHTITAWGADDLGNDGPTVATAFGIDLTSPTITVASTVPSLTNQTSVTVEGNATDGIDQSGLALVELSLDAPGQWTPIEFNPVTGSYAVTVPVNVGEHHLVVRSIDRAGNISAEAARSMVVDLTPPIMHINTPTSGTWTNTAQTIHWNTLASDLACSQGLVVWHSLDGASTATLSAACGDQITSEGSYLLTVYGTDLAGNDGPTTATAFGIDKTAPIMQITAPSNDTWTSQPLTLLWTTFADDLATSQGLLTWHPLDGSTTFTLSVQRGDLVVLGGRYALAVHGTDRVGNVGPITTASFGIDETRPTITLNAIEFTSSPLVICSGSAEDGHGCGIRGIKYRVDSGNWIWVANVIEEPTAQVPTRAVYNFNVTLATMGWHEIETVAVDRSGNTSLLALASVLVDMEAPTITVTHPVQHDTLFNTFQIDGRVSDSLTAVRAVQYRFDQPDEIWHDATVTSDTFSAIVNSWSLAEGPTSLTLRAVDTLGNDWDRSSEDANPVYRTITINNNYPPQAPTGLHASYSSFTQLELTWNKNTEADFSHYRIYRRDNGTAPFSEVDLKAGNVTDTSGTTLNTYTDQVTSGTATPYHYKLAMYAVDKAGNVSLISDTVSVPPPGTPNLHDAEGGDCFVHLDWDPVGEGFVKGYRVYRCQSEEPTSFTLYRTIEGKTNSEMTDTSVTYNLPYWYYVQAYDGAENVSQPSIQVKGVPNFVPNVEKTVIVAFEDAANNNNIEWDFDDVLVKLHGRLFLDQNDCVTSVSIDATLSIHDANTKYNVYTGFLNFVGTGTYSGAVWKDETKENKDEDIYSHVYQPNSSDLLTANIPLFKDVNDKGDGNGYYTELTFVLDNPSSNPLSRFDKVPFDTWITVKRSNSPNVYTYHIYDPTDPGCPYFNNAVVVTNLRDPLEGVALNTALVIPILNWSTSFNSTLWTVYPDFIGYANTYRTGTIVENTTWYLNPVD